MDDRHLRLEWMRAEFQDARRRHLVKTRARMASPTDMDVPPTTPAIATDDSLPATNQGEIASGRARAARSSNVTAAL
jgi:hypothetical protein